MRRVRRGDLSAPVLAIIVTVGIIAAGLVLMAWFWWFAPQAGKAGSLQILGQPAIIQKDNTDWDVVISVRNVGNVNITISKVVVNATACELTPSMILKPGESGVIEVTCSPTIGKGVHAIEGVIYTDYGIYTVSLTVIRRGA